MELLHLDIRHVLGTISEKEIFSKEKEIAGHLKARHQKTGKGNDFLGWLDLPGKDNKQLISEISALATQWHQEMEVVVVTGIGGSYLGARFVIEALSHHFPALVQGKAPLIIYAGQNISEDYLSDLLEVLEKRSFGVVVISKSGTTTEPAIAFRLLKNSLEKRFGKQAMAGRIIAITDARKGALRQMASEEGYHSFAIPDDIGGRFSVLTPVGLVPIAIAGFDIEALIEGARGMMQQTVPEVALEKNLSALYAATRNVLYRSEKVIEVLVNYEPALHYFSEWWKQLFGESEGKEHRGIFPASVDFTTDLHSMGQYIQEGRRHLFETVLTVKRPRKKLVIPDDRENLDTLNFMSGKRIDEVNKMAELGTLLAHVDGGVPNIRLEIPGLKEEYLGQMVYFFEKACAISGYMLGINPFDQPGVEAYKKNMFALLGKPGYEEEGRKLRDRLSV